MPRISTRELIRDTAAVHGWAWTARYYTKRMCFIHFYWLAFGKLPSLLRFKRQ